MARLNLIFVIFIVGNVLIDSKVIPEDSTKIIVSNNKSNPAVNTVKTEDRSVSKIVDKTEDHSAGKKTDEIKDFSPVKSVDETENFSPAKIADETDADSSAVRKTDETEDTSLAESDGSEDRFNLNFNRGHAQAFGPFGQHSGSDAETHAIEAGIRYPGGHRQPIFSHSGGHSSSFDHGRYGYGPRPQTWASGLSRPGGGHANAGFRGGPGFAHSHNINQQLAIPIDPFGAVLYSNLKEKNKTATPDEAKVKNSNSETPILTDGQSQPAKDALATNFESGTNEYNDEQNDGSNLTMPD